MRDLLQEIYSKRVNKYQEGGQIDEKTQQEFLQYLAQVTGAKTDDQLKQVLSKLSQQQMEQLYQKFLAQKQQGVQSARNGGKLEYRTNFILDEFANMPPLKDVDSMVTAARSRAIRFTFIIQNFAQLNDVYGEEVAQVIKGNCGNLIYLIS